VVSAPQRLDAAREHDETEGPLRLGLEGSRSSAGDSGDHNRCVPQPRSELPNPGSTVAAPGIRPMAVPCHARIA
jgi:hypothetical protein